MKSFTPPQLHPELAACVTGRSLRHPLIEFEYVDPCFYGRLNRLYEHRLHQLHGDYFPNQWDAFYPELSVIDRITKICFEIRRWSGPTFFRFIGEAWTAPEAITLSSSVLGNLLGASTQRADVQYMMTESEREDFQALPSEFVVYRGHLVGLEYGYCWTTEVGVAKLFANHSRHQGVVSTGIVLKDDVFAYINRREEFEIIVPTERVRDMTTLMT